MSIHEGRLFYGFESPKGATTGFRSLPESGTKRMRFKEAFGEEAAKLFLSHFDEATLDRWQCFPFEIDTPDGMLNDEEVAERINQKLVADCKDEKVSTFNWHTDIDHFVGVRYVYVNGIRWCEHAYYLVMDGDCRELPQGGPSETLLIILSWKAE